MKLINKANGCIYGCHHQRIFNMKLLLDDKGWVEGFIDSFNNEKGEERRFVFGVFYPEKVIELFKLPLNGNNIPLNLHLEKCSINYKGQVLKMSEPNEELYGLCSLIIQGPELDSENTHSEIEDLKRKIEEWKDSMDPYGKAFYYEAFQNRSRIMKVVANSYKVESAIKKLLKR